MKLIAIDHGYYSTKQYDGREIYMFKSKIEENTESINNTNTYHISYQGSNYVIGDGASNNCLDYDKTSNDYNKLFTLTILAKLMKDEYEEFNLVAGYPLNLYSTNKNIFSKYLKTQDYIAFTFQNQTKKLKVKNCLVFPQGAGALFTNPSQYKDKLVAVIDIGGLTVNGCIFDCLNLQTNNMFTVNQGCIILFNKLKKVLNNIYTQNIQEYEIPNILENGLYINGEKQKCTEIIDKILLDHCKIIKAECKKHNWNIESLEILVTGGGAIVLDGYLQYIIPQAKIMEDPVFANVKGFYEVGRHYYEKNF